MMIALLRVPPRASRVERTHDTAITASLSPNSCLSNQSRRPSPFTGSPFSISRPLLPPKVNDVQALLFTDEVAQAFELAIPARLRGLRAHAKRFRFLRR